MKYANIVLKLIIAYIVRQYRIKTLCKLEEVRFRMNVTVCLVNDKIFEIEERTSYWHIINIFVYLDLVCFNAADWKKKKTNLAYSNCKSCFIQSVQSKIQITIIQNR